MDEATAVAGSSSTAAATDGTGRQLKGRGATGDSSTTLREASGYDVIDGKKGVGPAKSIEGWIIMVTGLHDEAQEDDVHDKFCDFGDIKSLHLNLDRRTGYVKGYALIEFNSQKEAQGAIDTMDGEAIMGKKVHVDWAFTEGPSRGAGGGNGRR